MARGVAEQVFGALGSCLPAPPSLVEGEGGEIGDEESEGMNVTSPVMYFLQVIICVCVSVCVRTHMHMGVCVCVHM